MTLATGRNNRAELSSAEPDAPSRDPTMLRNFAYAITLLFIGQATPAFACSWDTSRMLDDLNREEILLAGSKTNVMSSAYEQEQRRLRLVQDQIRALHDQCSREDRHP
jgi:hypothetical protein